MTSAPIAPAKSAPAPVATPATPPAAPAALVPPYPTGHYFSPDLGKFTLNGPMCFLSDGSRMASPVGVIAGIVRADHPDYAAYTPSERQAIWESEQTKAGRDGKTAARRIAENTGTERLRASARRKLTLDEQRACGLLIP